VILGQNPDTVKLDLRKPGRYGLEEKDEIGASDEVESL
jgi:hypothetical protein